MQKNSIGLWNRELNQNKCRNKNPKIRKSITQKLKFKECYVTITLLVVYFHPHLDIIILSFVAQMVQIHENRQHLLHPCRTCL